MNLNENRQSICTFHVHIYIYIFIVQMYSYCHSASEIKWNWNTNIKLELSFGWWAEKRGYQISTFNPKHFVHTCANRVHKFEIHKHIYTYICTYLWQKLNHFVKTFDDTNLRKLWLVGWLIVCMPLVMCVNLCVCSFSLLKVMFSKRKYLSFSYECEFSYICVFPVYSPDFPLPLVDKLLRKFVWFSSANLV